MRRGLRAPRPRCAGDDRQAVGDDDRGEHYRPVPPADGLLPRSTAYPAEYRNEKALADLMLGEHAIGYVGGAGSCSGCGEATALRMLVAATRQVHGPESMGIVAATGCNTVYGSTYPYNPYLVPWTNSLFENAPADALGIRLRWDQAGTSDRRLWVVGGDGAMYDIGFQALSRMVASGADIKVMVLDTQAYSNTGGQSSTASFGGQVTKLSAYGRELHGRPERRKELGRILIAHGDVFVAQTTTAHINHFYRAVMDANEFPGPAVIIVHTPCQPEHGIADDASAQQSRLAVDSRAFPLFSYDPRRGDILLIGSRSRATRPSARIGIARPAARSIDFLAFARTEGRFAAHFAADGTPSPEIEATRPIGWPTGELSRRWPASRRSPRRRTSNARPAWPTELGSVSRLPGCRAVGRSDRRAPIERGGRDHPAVALDPDRHRARPAAALHTLRSAWRRGRRRDGGPAARISTDRRHSVGRGSLRFD